MTNDDYTRDEYVSDEIFTAVYNPALGIDLRDESWQVISDTIRDHLKAEELLADEHHSLDELYDYRMAYNALTFNMWARLGMYDVHKSWKHSDGEPCFGGGWFIVNATTPHGLVSNHYPEKYWDLFSMEHRETPVEYDGHTPQEALQRLIATAEDQKYMELTNG